MCVSQLDALVLNQTQIHTWWGQGGSALGLFAVSGGCSVRVVLWCFFFPIIFIFFIFFIISFALAWVLFWGFSGEGGAGLILGVFWRTGG